MRRKEKEITTRAVIDAIIRQARVCRLALSEDNQPYVVPLCFGYENDTLYFHCAPKGRKLDIIMKQYSEGSFSFPLKTLQNLVVIKVEIDYMCGKQSWN